MSTNLRPLQSLHPDSKCDSPRNTMRSPSAPPNRDAGSRSNSRKRGAPDHNMEQLNSSSMELSRPPKRQSKANYKLESPSHSGPNHSIKTISSPCDREAAAAVINRLESTRLHHNLTHRARILRRIIDQRTPLDDVALDMLLGCANNHFFKGKLKDVTWRWSKENETQYRLELLGTASKRLNGGDSSLCVVLSKPLLQKSGYSSRLTLSTFLHELIHCYLFVTCGPEHACIGECGGHTDGFRRIAEALEKWIGHDRLKLGNMSAKLEDFLEDFTDVDTCLNIDSTLKDDTVYLLELPGLKILPDLEGLER